MRQALASMRYLMFGGEALDADSVVRTRVASRGRRNDCCNGYGPTENTTFSTATGCERWRRDAATVPIGRPIANTQVMCWMQRAAAGAGGSEPANSTWAERDWRAGICSDRS